MEPTLPAFSVVVPAFEDEATIAECVHALSHQTMPREEYEILVVDDGSTDRTASEAQHAGADVVRLPCNLGPGAARNVGIERARGFDPHLRICEDQEMSFRLHRAGLRMVFVPDARTVHHHSETIRAYLRKKFRIARWKVRVLQEHPSKVLGDSHTPPLMKLEI